MQWNAKTLGLVVSCVVIFATVVAAGSVTSNLLKGPKGPKGLSIQIDRELAHQSVFRTLRKTFPDEYAELRSVLLTRAEAGASEAEISAAGFNYVRSISIRHAPDVAAAPAPLLKDYASAQGDLMRALRDQNPQLCADFAFRALSPGVQLQPKSAKAGMANLEAQLKAARAGRDHPVARRTAAPEDYAEVSRIMIRNGLRPEQLRMLSDGGAATLSAAEQCDLGLKLFDAVREAPAETSARITAALTIAAADQLKRG